jgi:hypothetical protein
MSVPSLDERASYVPPSSQSMAAAQNEVTALRLLLAQRRLYSKAKRWALLRSVGFSVVAVAAPLITAIWPDASVAVGAFAGVWIFLSRTAFVSAERYHSSRGAIVQELFDLRIYRMPQLALRQPHVTPEEISRLVGDDDHLQAAVTKQRLRDWYPIDTELSGSATIAIAQRANAAYAERLLRSNAFIWLSLTILWSVIAVIISLLLGFSLATFLLGVALPLLPALLDVFDQWRTTRQAGAERRALAQGIEEAIKHQDGKNWTAQDLLVWQEQLYNLRRDAPQIPNIVYWRTRKKNERDMKAAASELADVAKAESTNSGHDENGGS